MQLEDMGNAVKLTGKMISRSIPAMNIQVENVPGLLAVAREKPEWYGIYFEIPFEDGDLWIVEQGWIQSKPDSKLVRVQEYKDWAHNPTGKKLPYREIPFRDWDAFLVGYHEKAQARE